MKNKIIIFIFAIFILIACDNSGVREQATIKWVESAERPIICKKYSRGELYAIYTLFSANGKVFTTGCVRMEFPDTIK